MKIEFTGTCNWDAPNDLKKEYMDYLKNENPTLESFERFLVDTYYWDDDIKIIVDNDEFQNFLNND